MRKPPLPLSRNGNKSNFAPLPAADKTRGRAFALMVAGFFFLLPLTGNSMADQQPQLTLPSSGENQVVPGKAPGGGRTAELAAFLTEYEKRAAQGEDPLFRKNLLLDYLSYGGKGVRLRPLPAGETPAGEETARQPSGAERSKAAIFFQMLKNETGPEPFSLALQNFRQQEKFTAAGWDGLLAAINEAAGRDLSSFFSQWLERSAIPTLSLKDLRLEEKEGQSILSFQLLQEQKEPYQLAVPIEIVTPLGPVAKTVEIRDKETAVEIPLADVPSLLTIDPGYTMLRRLVPDEIPPSWSRFAGDPEKLAVLPPEEERERFQPLLELLDRMNCKTVAAETATDADLAHKGVIFLGTATPIARSLFANPGHPEGGVTVDVRENPLGPGHVAVLLSAAGSEELALALGRLPEYERFSRLYFEKGEVRTKAIAESELGQIYLLDTPPQGMIIANLMDFKDIAAMLADKKVVYVGESHDRNEDHLLQLRVIRALYAQNPDIAIGMEMFNHPSQPVLDQYVAGEIDEREFLKKSHYFEKWRFDYRFYQDILGFARKHRIPVVALNLEKEIVSRVFKEGGSKGLAGEGKEDVPPERDLSLPGYRDRISQAFTMHGAHGAPQKDLNNFLQAQALWDETMADSVTRHLSANPGRRMVVLAGMGHTDRANGIPPRVARRLPEARQAVVLNGQPGSVSPEVADFVVFSPPAPLKPALLIGVMLEDTKEGLLVTNVAEQGKAQEAGIRKDDIIVGVGSEPLQKLEDLKIVMFYKKAGETIQVSIKRKGFWGDQVMTFPITLTAGKPMN